MSYFCALIFSWFLGSTDSAIIEITIYLLYFVLIAPSTNSDSLQLAMSTFQPQRVVPLPSP